MRIITKPAERGESVCLCDVCHGKIKAVAWMQFLGGYGSDFDMLKYSLDLCNIHANELVSLLKEKYPSLREKELDILENPWDY